MPKIHPTTRTWLLSFAALTATLFALWWHFIRTPNRMNDPKIINIRLLPNPPQK